MFTVDEIIKVCHGTLVVGESAAVTVSGVSTDSRTIKKGDCFVALTGDTFDGHAFIEEAVRKGARAVVVQRPVKQQKSIAVIQVDDTLKALGELALCQRLRCDPVVIAITGSNGKTTTKDMIAWALGERFAVLKTEGTKNNAIGLPMTLLSLKPKHAVCVVEIGTNHFGEVEYLANICRPTIGVITTIGASHLEFLLNLEGVFKEKSSLFKHLTGPRIGIVNGDDVFLREYKKRQEGAFTVSFGMQAGVEYTASDIAIKNGKISFAVNGTQKFELATCGAHNVYNALAAIAVSRMLGLSFKDIAQRLKKFVFPVGRLNLVRVNGVNFLDDTYNSNPLSLSCAIDAVSAMPVSGRRIFVMGDMLELGQTAKDFHQQAAGKIGTAIDCFIGVGELTKSTAQALSGGGRTGEVFTCGSAREAKEILRARVAPGANDIVLVKGSRKWKLEEILKQ